MSNRTNNMRDIINSVRDLQDLGDVINGRNVYNININYYENYSNIQQRADSLDVNDSMSDDDSLVISEEGGKSTSSSDTDEVIDDIDSTIEMEIESPISRQNIPIRIRTDLACPSGHFIEYINNTNTQITCRCCEAPIISRYYRCVQSTCGFTVCNECVDNGTYYRNRTSIYNPDNYNNYIYNIPRSTPSYVSRYNLANTTDIASNTPLNQNSSDTQLSNIDNITNLIGNSLTDSITNTLTDIINNQEVQNNLGNESINITVSEIGTILPRGLTVKNLVEKTDLVVFRNITQPESKCHICNEEYTMYDICRKIENCGHYYHSDCIDNWFINNKNCPICNQNV